MQCFVMAFLYLLFVLGSEGITTHSVTGCSDRVLLNCSNTEMIHVERITYYNGTDCNQAVTDLQVCGSPFTGSDTGLVPACNGKTTCNEILHDSYCPGSRAAKVDYRCIPRSNVKDMCDAIVIENTNIIFLSTPRYPSSPSFTGISPCRCSIRGASITSIQILELRLHTSNDGAKSSLEINYGDVTYKPESFNDTTRRLVYNKRLSTATTTAEITLNHNGINREYLWIEVQGVSMRVECNIVMSTSTSSTKSPTTTKSPVISTPQPYLSLSSPSPPPSSSPPPSPSSSPPSSSSTSSSTDSSSTTTTTPQTADIHVISQNQDSTSVIAGSVVGAVILIAIVIIIFIFIYRSKKLPHGEREINPYSGLDQNQRVAGNDGTYQELNTMNLTSQYINVSQNTHNDYYNLN